MDSSSGTSSNSSGLQNSGSEEDLQLVMDQRKRKRMISNRESARRSRIRKQKHLDDLTAQVAQLRNHNHQILAGVKLTMEQYVNVESENAILRAQAAELTHRLHSLLEIVGFCNDDSAHGFPLEHDAAAWNCLSQPIGMMAAAPDSALLY